MTLVRNLVSPRGNEVPNQFVITGKNGNVFQSYDTIVAATKNGKVYIGPYWDYSNTTLRYFKQFANFSGIPKRNIQKMIENKEIVELSREELEKMLGMKFFNQSLDSTDEK